MDVVARRLLRLAYSDRFSVSDEVNASCTGDATQYLLDICMSLPEEHCLSEPLEEERPRIDDDKFSCGNGQCVHGLKTCDHKYDCDETGADELQW